MSHTPNLLKNQQPFIGSPEEFADKASEYFEACIDEKRTPTVAGLCLYMGFASRQSFQDYKKREGFGYVVARAHLVFEDFHEGRLPESNPTGSIFWLKANAGYNDRPELPQEDVQELVRQFKQAIREMDDATGV